VTDIAETPPAIASKHLWVESMDMDAQGIAHRSDGKVVFIDGALPFEEVSANIHKKKNNWEQGSLVQVHRASSQRVTPHCPHFGMHAGACGGCKMQHLNAFAQVAVKQRVLEDNLWHLGKVQPSQISRALQGPAWGYRFRARLSVKYVHKKGKVLIGFHERKSRYVADMESCAVLPEHVSRMLIPLRHLIGDLDAKDSCPQIELACGDTLTALVLRHLHPLSESDILKLTQFGLQHAVQWWLQPKGPDSITLLDEQEKASLSYGLPQFGLIMQFRPADFTQVNPQINQALVARAIQQLDINREDKLIDWFCGLGNFTLPMATQAGSVTGVEGSQSLLDWAAHNVSFNAQALSQSEATRSLCEVEFLAMNLFEIDAHTLVSLPHANKWLIDPPREGAFALVKALAAGLECTDHWTPPTKIVYVSCNPATLARDAEVLVHQAGYECTSAGVVNMFPHTAHVESMAVFERA
jgi:23S rRNA (uracil1939-C5)-methyltransferase